MHAFGAGAQHQMIGVAENDVGAGIDDLIEVDGLDGCRRSDGHEAGRADETAWGHDLAEACEAILA